MEALNLSLRWVLKTLAYLLIVFTCSLYLLCLDTFSVKCSAIKAAMIITWQIVSIEAAFFPGAHTVSRKCSES